MTTYSVLRRITISFALTFILPTLVLIYLWDKVTSNLYPVLFLSTIICTGLGFYFIYEMIQQMLILSQQAKDLARGKSAISRPLVKRPDELGELGSAIQDIAQNIEEKMQKLQNTAAILEQTKRELSETTLYAESVIRSMADAMIILDGDLKIKSANRATCELLGFNPEDLKGKNIDILLDSASFDDTILLKDLQGLGENRIGTLCGRKATLVSSYGERIPVDVNVSPLQFKENPVSGAVMIARDMRKMLALISELEQANFSLEEKIKSRASDIERAYLKLKEKDVQILHQEKMASIGLLAAGIAHEINNPIGYVNSNLDVLGEYVADIETYTRKLEGITESLRSHPLPPGVTASMEEVSRLKGELKVDDLFQDVSNIVKESRGGIDRVKRIVSDLRNFSHADENKMEEADLNQGIESTLNIVWNELKYRAQVQKSYAPLPKIRCYPQQLNQVFMNLLINAAQAIENKGEIRIKTYHDSDYVYVEVADTGSGIPPENLQKIFEPFFTTKPVGKGTGLGLSIVYSIIQKHQGEIQVKSEVGKGTTFTIQLPLNLKEEEDEGAKSPRRG